MMETGIKQEYCLFQFHNPNPIKEKKKRKETFLYLAQGEGLIHKDCRSYRGSNHRLIDILSMNVLSPKYKTNATYL